METKLNLGGRQSLADALQLGSMHSWRFALVVASEDAPRVVHMQAIELSTC